MYLLTLDLIPDFFGVKIDAENWDMLGKLKDFVFSDILGVKIVAKKVDTLGNSRALARDF